MELFKLLGTIAINNSEAKKALRETSAAAKDTADDIGDVSSSTEKSGSKWGSAFKKIGSGALAVGKTVAVGIGAATTAIGGLTVKALSSAGELEQNMGGSEAVFGKYATKIQDTAKKAFSNMGLSTSDYLGTANKMGALFQGAGFDIEESMKLSQDSMQRAADVASIMGIDTASAMEAVAGAAKGNFTMMDNLGVAMNETTLANYALEKGMKKSYDQMTQQEKIGLAMEMFMEKTAYAAGNYAKENETLAGSLRTAKAALSNFLSGSGSVDDVVSSFSNLADVVVKNIDTMFPKLMTGITQIVQKIVPMIPPLLQKLLPPLISGATSLINGLVAAMPAIVQALLAAVPTLIQGIMQIVNALIEALPSLMQMICAALPTLIPALISGLVSMIVTLCANFGQIILPIIDNLPMIIESICTALLDNLPQLLEAGKQLLMGLLEGMIALVGKIPEILKIIWESIVNGIKSLFGIHSPSTVMADIGKNIMEGLINGIKNLIGKCSEAMKAVWEGIKKIFSNVGGWFKDQFSKGAENAKKAWSTITNFFSNIWKGIKNAFSGVGKWFGDQFRQGKENAQKAWSTVKNFFSNIWSGIKNVFSSVGSWFRNIFTSAKNGIQNAWSGVKNFFSNIKNGIVNAFSNVKEKLSAPFTKARDAIKGVADKIKGFFKGEIKMPKIKLPHFKIKPSGWKVGDLLEGKIPKLGIEWYAKAMNNPMILTKPSVFGYNAETGQFMGGGDVPGGGGEVVSGTNTLMNMIQDTVSNENSNLVYYLNKIVEILATYFPQILEKLGMPVPAYFDPNQAAEALAVPMNYQLGKLSKRKDRGI